MRRWHGSHAINAFSQMIIPVLRILFIRAGLRVRRPPNHSHFKGIKPVTANRAFLVRVLPYICLALALSVQVSVVMAKSPIVHPGAPGEPARNLSAEEASKIANTSFSPADVRFMQDMIPHHHQALEMAKLAPERTNRADLLEAAKRIEASQSDEIKFMQDWLRERGLEVPDPAAHQAMHTEHKMAGMATPEQMAKLAASKSADFDRQFLELMIKHHEGAVKMVKKLLELPGTAFDPVLFEFTTDVTNDQTAEIEKMNALLASLSSDPRANLAAGFKDAGESLQNLEHVASLPRPVGFFDPKNPSEVPPPDKKADEKDKAAKGKAAQADEKEEEKPKTDEEDHRYALLSFANSDMAFSGDVLVTGSYHGFNIWRLGKNGKPELLSSVVCPGGQGDVSIVGNLLIMSVEQLRGRRDCGLGGVNEEISPDRFRGLRIFDISDLTRPVQVGAVQTCRGSHTHSVVSGPGKDGKIIVYNSGISEVRDAKEMEGCYDELPGDDRTALFRIDVIEIPVADPSKARIIGSPAVFADPGEGGVLAGLWRGGDHGDETQETYQTDHCHDITVFPELGIAAGACSGNGILFDISDPLNPKRMHEVVDPGFAYWHSATFNNDGTKVIFTDEWGGGMRARCRAYDPINWGADAIYDIVDRKLVFKGYFKMPAPQSEKENCVAHNGSIVPVPGRDIFVQSWYQGGISLIDFTDSTKPVEIAWFDRGPVDAENLVLAGYWSSYWYHGRIYGTEILRGLDVFKLTPSEYLSENELAAAAIADQGRLFNPQQQFRVTWPADPAVARAHIDQLKRSKALADPLAADLLAVLDVAESTIKDRRHDADLAAKLGSLAAGLNKQTGDAISTRQSAELAEALLGIAAKVKG